MVLRTGRKEAMLGSLAGHSPVGPFEVRGALGSQGRPAKVCDPMPQAHSQMLTAVLRSGSPGCDPHCVLRRFLVKFETG